MQKNNGLFSNKAFTLFFISQTMTGSGGFIQMIAVAALLFSITHSGAVTGFGIVCAPLPGIFFSLFAGSVGDRFDLKKILVLLNIIRAFLTLGFFFCDSALQILALMLGLNSLDVFYNPSKNKFLTAIVGKDQLITGNSVLNGGYGFVSILVPLITGAVISTYSVQFAFLLNSFAYLFSAACLSKIDYRHRMNRASAGRRPAHNITNGIQYCIQNQQLLWLIILTAAVEFGTISVNIAFYAFAFDTLKVTSKVWGLMLSVVYGMNVVSMFVIIYFKKIFTRKTKTIVWLTMVMISAVWCFYSVADSFYTVFIAEAFEGFSLAVCNTLLLTELLRQPGKEYTGRVVGIRDAVSNIAKLLGACVTYIVLSGSRERAVFQLNALILLLFAVAQMFYIHKNTIDAKRNG